MLPCRMALIFAVPPLVEAIQSGISKTPPTFSCERDSLLVYTLGKAGTTSFTDGIEKLCGHERKVVYLQGGTMPKYPQNVKTHNGHDLAADFLEKVPADRPRWIVTMVRNPYDRLIARFFQTRFCEFDGLGNDDAIEAITSEMHSEARHYDTIEYFRLWNKTTGMDPLSWHFDESKKHIFAQGKLHGKPLNVIFLRMEDIDQWSSVLSSYFPNYKLGHDNVGDSKVYSDLYQEFKECFKYSEEDVKAIEQNSAEKHFYTARQWSEIKNAVPIESNEHLLRVASQAMQRLDARIRETAAARSFSVQC